MEAPFTLIEDTRQKANKHNIKHDYFNMVGVNILRSKLPVGDYANVKDLSTVIDTKQNIMELATDCTQQHERFRRELQTAQSAGIHLIVLVENEDGITDINGLYNWYNWRRRISSGAITGRQLAKIVLTMQQKYGVEFVFCRPDQAGEFIVNTLRKD